MFFGNDTQIRNDHPDKLIPFTILPFTRFEETGQESRFRFVPVCIYFIYNFFRLIFHLSLSSLVPGVKVIIVSKKVGVVIKKLNKNGGHILFNCIFTT